MATEVFDASNCPCCDGGTVECSCCTAPPSANATFDLPTMSAGTNCDICGTYSGGTVIGAATGPCSWFGEDVCGTTPDRQFIFWTFSLSCGGGDVIASAEVNVQSESGGNSDTVWQKNLGAAPIDCSALSVTFDSGDVIASDNSGPCDVGDDLTVTL